MLKEIASERGRFFWSKPVSRFKDRFFLRGDHIWELRLLQLLITQRTNNPIGNIGERPTCPPRTSPGARPDGHNNASYNFREMVLDSL